MFRSALLAILILGLSPVQAQAQGIETCNAKINIYAVDGPQPFFVGDTLTLKSTVGAGQIKDNDRTGAGGVYPFIEYTGIGYGVDCGGGDMATLSDCKPQGFGEYEDAGHDIEFLGVTHSDCPTSEPAVRAEWPLPESDNIVAIPVLNGVVRQFYDPTTQTGDTCMVDVSFKVNDLHESSNWVTQALGLPFDNRTPGDPEDDMVGTCSNDLSAAGYGKATFKVETCGLDVVKQVSFDGETWFDADSEDDAPRLGPEDTAFYRLVMKNTSSVDFVGDLHVLDGNLGVDAMISPAFDENGEMIITGGEFDIAGACAQLLETGEGFFMNEASVEGTCRAEGEGVSAVTALDSDVAYINCFPFNPRSAAIQVVKATNGVDANSPPGPYIPVGDPVTWSYNVFNIGNEGVTIDSLIDNMEGEVTCEDTFLARDEFTTCTAIVGVAGEGQYANIATVKGTSDYTGSPVQDVDPSHYFGMTAAIDLVKTADPAMFSTLGEEITYTFAVTNLSNVALTNVYVTDPLPGLGEISCPKDMLAIDESMNCTATYLITQDDMNAGVVDNTATAFGTAPNGSEVQDSDSAQITSTPQAALSLVKTAVPSIYTAAGQNIGYTYVLTNNGNVTLYPAYSVIDDKTTVSCPQDDAALEPGEQVVCTASYTIQAADVTAGSVTNVAQGQAFDGEQVAVLSNQDQETVYYAALTVSKEIYDDGEWLSADDTDSAPVRFWPAGAQYRVVVENTGAVDLENVTFTDVNLGIADQSVNGGTLAVGEQVTITSGDFAVLDVETACEATGEVQNTALVSGTTATGGTPVSDSDDAWLVCVGTPEITVKKYISIDDGVTWVDDTAGPVDAPSGALYKITVSNTGNVKLVNVTLDDSLIGGDPFSVDDLEVGASVDVTSGEWTELAMSQVCGSSGLIQNTVTASGTSDDRESDTDTDTDSAWLECIGPPQIGIVKEVSLDGGDTWLDANEEPFPTALYDPETPVPALYRITVYNIGDEDLTNVLVNDSTLGIVDYLVGDLAVGANAVIDSGTLEALYVDNLCTSTGEKANVADATGETETGTSDQAFDSATVVCVGTPAIQVLKEVSDDGVNFSPTGVTMVAPNDGWYRFTVTNIGNVDLENVVVNDSLLGIVDFVPYGTGGPGTLAVGETVVIAHEGAGDNTLFDLYVPGLCSSETLGDIVNTVIVDGDSAESPAEVSDEDSVGVSCEMPFDICEAYNRPGTLTMEYNGTPWSDNSQINDTAVPADAILPASATIKVYDKNALKATYSPVAVGGEFMVYGKWTPSGYIPTTVKVEIYDGDELRQTISFHGSCSEPLLIGDKFGGVTIVKASQGKDE